MSVSNTARKRIEAIVANRLGTLISFDERLLVKCSPGLESLLRRELTAIGIVNSDTQWLSSKGGIEVIAQPGSYQKICLMR